MQSLKKTTPGESSLAEDLRYALRYYLGSRRAIIVMIIGTLAFGMYLNWGWFVALGIAPLLISVLPCAVICALGLCMHKGSGRKCAAKEQKAEATDELQAKRHSDATDDV